MKRFAVWDSINEDETVARDISAMDPKRAAEKYAEMDIDGQLDGLYANDNGHPLHVRDDDLGEVFEVCVAIDDATRYDAVSVARSKA